MLPGDVVSSALTPSTCPAEGREQGHKEPTLGPQGRGAPGAGVSEEVSAGGVVLGRLSGAQGFPPGFAPKVYVPKGLTRRHVMAPKAPEQAGRALWTGTAPGPFANWSSHLQIGPATPTL